MADYDKLLQVPRATKDRLESIKLNLLVNTIVYATDTKELGVKLSNGNIEYFMNATDMNARFNSKQDKLIAGSNITINPTTNVISATGEGGDGIPEAPINNKLYGRKNAAWSEIISGGGGGELDPNEMAYFDFAGSIYGAKYNLLANAWQDMKNSETVLFDIPLMLAAPNQEMGGMTIDLYVGTDGQLQAFYDACVNQTITPQDVYYVNNVATRYNGDVSGDIGFPIPLYNFGTFDVNNNASFLIGDLTPLSMGLGLVLAKIVNVSIPNNNIVIQQGFEFENESGIIIPTSVTSIGDYAFRNWSSNNQPLVIPNSVTSIEIYAFRNWTSNNQPLVIPNSVTSIGEGAFYDWLSNNQPLVIPDSVTSIGDVAFGNWTLVPYVEMKRTTPPSLVSANAFAQQNNAPIYVPDGSVEAYKTATNWVDLADRIFPMSDMTGGGGGSDYVLTKSKIDTALSSLYLGSIQLGEDASASGDSSTAVGHVAIASEDYAVALGRNAKAEEESSTAVGHNASAEGSNSTALGQGASATGTSTTALGRGATASFSSSTAVGREASATYTYSTALGSEASAEGENSTAVGSNARAQVIESIALGYNTNASGNRAAVLGSEASATGSSSTALGYNTSASGNYSTALGLGASASGAYSTAVGASSRASKADSTALGTTADASGAYSTAVGSNAETGISDYTMRLGSTDLAVLNSQVALTVTSDIRDKADIEEVPKALDFIKDLNPITYVGNNRDKYISDEQKETDTYKDYLMVEDYDRESHSQGTKKGSRRRVGLSAQEVREKLIEHYGSDNYANVVNDNFVEFEERGLNIPEGLENKLSMSYETMVPFLIKAIQEQQEQIEELKNNLKED